MKPIQASADATAIERIALSAEEVADVLGISRAHVWKLHSIGKLPRPVRLGRVVRWDRKILEAWLAAGAPPRDRWEPREMKDGR
ncbi:MAG: helix-turn-helix domain-containing protein [Phycisphaerales bacterium]|nr:helix-turn-helix domain-containing protein [Phycisphaerales bacterium]